MLTGIGRGAYTPRWVTVGALFDRTRPFLVCYRARTESHGPDALNLFGRTVVLRSCNLAFEDVRGRCCGALYARRGGCFFLFAKKVEVLLMSLRWWQVRGVSD